MNPGRFCYWNEGQSLSLYELNTAGDTLMLLSEFIYPDPLFL